MPSKAVLFAGYLFMLLASSACWPKNNKSEESQFDAITAASKRIFGKNVRGYMWALTTDSPALFAQAPSAFNSGAGMSPVTFDPFSTSPMDSSGITPPQAAVGDLKGSGVSPGGYQPTDRRGLYKTDYFQCWYYAETAVFEKLEGPALRRLFLDKTKTKKLSSNFLDVQYLFREIERSEALKNLESFALTALPGTCFLFNAIGPLKGKARGALANAFCSLSLASLATTRKSTNDGWGSDKAREHIQNQLKAKVDELSEVNWDVLVHLKNKVAEFNSTSKFSETTQVQCPSNEAWVAELMGPLPMR